MTDILFQITKDNLDTGLRGYPVGYCATSSVDPYKGLSYANIPVAEFVNNEPEAVIYLLYTGKNGTPEEIKSFTDDLRSRATLPSEVVKQIQSLPRKGHPMKLLSTSLMLCGMLAGENDYRQDCLNLIAKAPQLVATMINHHAGWGQGAPSCPDLGYMENFVQMLNIPKCNKAELIPVFKLFNILHYDHGGGNLSTFVGKAVASGLEDMYGSLAAAMCALAGPRHGRANQDCLEFVHEVYNMVGDHGSEDDIERLIRKRLADGELIFGFGHAVLRVEDARATVFYETAGRNYPNHPLVKIATLLRKVGPKVLGENPKIADPYPNVDAISGVVLSAAGFPFAEYFTVLFGLSRIVGIAIQIVNERCEARGGKGTPIVRPKYIFQPRT